MFYSLTFNDVATGAAADTFKTLAALIAADTAGHRCRLRALNVGPADDGPSDLNVELKIARIADVSAGGAGTTTAVTAANMGRPESVQRDGVITGGRNYTVEPTAYETEPLWTHGMNIRGGFFKEWGVEEAPVLETDQILGLLAAPRSAAAIRLSGTLIYEEF